MVTEDDVHGGHSFYVVCPPDTKQAPLASIKLLSNTMAIPDLTIRNQYPAANCNGTGIIHLYSVYFYNCSQKVWSQVL
eukprot:6535923-Ditylum_brightwellii.AAC.3